VGGKMSLGYEDGSQDQAQPVAGYLAVRRLAHRIYRHIVIMLTIPSILNSKCLHAKYLSFRTYL